MLPGYAIADTLFAAPAAGRGDAARAGSGNTKESGDFEALLQGQPARNTGSGKSAPRETGEGASRLAKSNPAKSEAVVTDEQLATDQIAQPPVPTPGATTLTADTPELAASDEGSAGAALQPESSPETELAEAGVPEKIDETSGSADSDTAEDTSGGEDTADIPVTPDAGTRDAATTDQALPPAPVTGTQADIHEGGNSPAGENQNGNSAGVEPAAPAAPAAPASDTAAEAGKPAQAKSAEPPASQSAQPAQPKTGSGQQAPVQPQGASSASGTPAGQTDAPGTAQTAASNAQQAKADLAAQPGKAEGDVPNAAAVRREMERGVARGPEGLEQARAAAEKAESGAKDAPLPTRHAAMPATPAPAPASTPQAAAPPPSMAAMLTALQSGIAAPETLEASEGTEIRLESSSALLARNESAGAAGTRTTSVMPHLRMASGHVADLGQMIARRFADGSRSFDIRLDPPELGRVQVRLEIGADRSVQAMLTADKPEALAELQRNARELEKALADAGLDLGENGIGFALSEGSEDDQASPDREEHGSGPAITTNLTISEESTPAPASRYGFLMAGRTGVDMRI